MLVMALYNVVDTIFIGRVVGSLGIAGLSVVFPVQMIVMGVGQMIGLGGASLVSKGTASGGATVTWGVLQGKTTLSSGS